MKGSLRIKKAPFTMVVNNLLEYKELSLAAKGLYAFMYSKPDDWDFTIVGLASLLKESKNTVNKLMRELRSLGWVTYKRYSNGTVEYTIEIEPLL